MLTLTSLVSACSSLQSAVVAAAWLLLLQQEAADWRSTAGEQWWKSFSWGKMNHRKAIFGAFLISFCLGMLGLFFMNKQFDKCYFCLKHADNSTYNNSDLIKKSFIEVPEANCEQSPPYLVLLVTTTHSQKMVRTAIRNTWGKEKIIQGKRVVTFFLLGTTSPSPDDASLSEEVSTYKDIIQKDFVDTYYNLTYKTLMGIEWLVHFCPQATYAMKTDTDMFINTLYLVELLIRKNQTSNLFTGFPMFGDPPIRDVNSKWYASESEYPGNRYPPFCSGTGYVFSLDVAQRVHDISSSIPFFKLEDVYIGLCLDKLKITPQELHFKQVFFPIKPFFTVCTYLNLVTSHGVLPSEITLYWEAIERADGEKC